jgi:hypothetical protein
VDIENLSSRSLASDEACLTEIGDYLPADLSTLKRTVEKDSRNAETEADIKEVEEITLQDELSAIVEQFNNSLEELIPNPEKALSLPFVSEAEDGLLIGDDMIIPFKSIEGAVTVELLNAMADGENIENLLADFERDINSSLGTIIEDRSLWQKDTVIWPKGVVSYRWGSITNDYKQKVLEAMNTWSSSTNNKVSFELLPDTPWNNFQIGIHVIGCIVISKKDLGYTPQKGGTSGSSSFIGYKGGESSLFLDDSLSGDMLEKVALHELGHFLGLKHEHQRYDRDDYLDISADKLNDSTNYGIIPKEVSISWWGTKAIRIGRWTIKIPYLYWGTSTYSITKGAFDFDSIMLYEGFPVKQNKQYLNNGKPNTKRNYTLSYYDILMIKNQY